MVDSTAKAERARNQSADGAVLQAQRLRETGRLDEAANLVASVVQAEPDHLGALKLMGTLAMQTGATEIALGCFERAHAVSPRSLDVLLQLGNALLAGQRPIEAIEIFKRALALRPNDGAVFRGLAQAQLDMGDQTNALRSFRKTLSILPYDQYAAHMVTALSGEPAKGAAGYVANLFDGYAEFFDEHLTDTLEYRIPEAIHELLAERADAGPMQTLLDLGCGTGLVGAAVKDIVTTMDGIDIAPKMIRKAVGRGIYRHLKTGDAIELLAADTDFLGPYDVVAAADLFIYFGRLEAAFAAIARALAPKGLFAFSIESAAQDDVVIRSTGRFSHSADYIARLAADNGFAIIQDRLVTIRQERNQPIPGALYLLTRT